MKIHRSETFTRVNGFSVGSNAGGGQCVGMVAETDADTDALLGAGIIDKEKADWQKTERANNPNGWSLYPIVVKRRHLITGSQPCDGDLNPLFPIALALLGITEKEFFSRGGIPDSLLH